MRKRQTTLWHPLALRARLSEDKLKTNGQSSFDEDPGWPGIAKCLATPIPRSVQCEMLKRKREETSHASKNKGSLTCTPKPKVRKPLHDSFAHKASDAVPGGDIMVVQDKVIVEHEAEDMVLCASQDSVMVPLQGSTEASMDATAPVTVNKPALTRTETVLWKRGEWFGLASETLQQGLRGGELLVSQCAHK